MVLKGFLKREGIKRGEGRKEGKRGEGGRGVLKGEGIKERWAVKGGEEGGLSMFGEVRERRRGGGKREGG